jgi:hypothetical protein
LLGYAAQETTTTTTAPEPVWTKGGPCLQRHLATLKNYDAEYTKWIYGLPMSTASHGLGGVSNEVRIYVIGGGSQLRQSVSNVNEIFHTR